MVTNIPHGSNRIFRRIPQDGCAGLSKPEFERLGAVRIQSFSALAINVRRYYVEWKHKASIARIYTRALETVA